MARQEKTLPDTLTSPDTGEVLKRSARPYSVNYHGLAKTVDLPGYYPEGDGESVHVGDDMAAVDAALRDLKEAADGLPSPATIRRIRGKLKLSQKRAGLVFRVSASAFDKYERGLIEPSGPTVQLMRLLEKHPALLADLAGP